ncbi:Variant-specific surface protein [Giardia duodenalis]|uniref:Variant-specific surface protein n=1 Tax=Giardia intestinalis TaxID=5741 RepID=V6TWM8_GIAIN|nr:Variant-specific surface protein [Giardia intestinalis]
MCSGEFFLFRGGCYSTKSASGSEICTAASGGKCTTCNANGNYIFQNRAAVVTLGNECILCWDTTGADKYTGVENCHMCTAPGSTGAATCDTCQDGYYKAGDACTPCTSPCATCDTSITHCTSCITGNYLRSDGSCASTCDQGYPDPETMTCKACTEIHAQCTQCSFDSSKGRPQCSACTGQILKTELDGTVTCVEADACATGNTHFKTDDNRCVPCSDTTGIANCATCSDKTTCITCLEGYIKEGDNAAATCQACGTGCATCAKKTENTQCQTCKPGYFLKGSAPSECIACDGTTQGGIDGCAECSGTTGSLKCTKCKPNRKSKGESGNYTCEEKTCEDETACGGTAGACGAIVVGGDGSMKYYCSYCGESTKFPIDGICKGDSDKGSNQCSKGVCTQCADGYFLYMGGCYSVSKEPGSLMCSKAITAGVCDTPSANSRYFAVPGATDKQQSVLGCGNPLGTTTGTGDIAKAYVGVEGCRTCTAPSEASNGAMASAKCTACDEGKALTGSGYGCVTCGIPGCSACRADNMCEACSDGYRLEGDTCVRTGGNLSTGAIAGISVAAVVVVGGLVGFLCWWFICRGKA